MNNDFIIKRFKNAEYQTTHTAMLNKTLARISDKKNGIASSDELWIVEHQDVYTLGQAGKESHILIRNDTPIIKTDRGGQVTWHGRGQLVIYWLFDLTELNWKVRDLVSHAEQAIEDIINSYLSVKCENSHNISSSQYIAKARQDAPGVYIYNVNENSHKHMIGKVASLGFKIKQGFSYHGIAINLHCDLTPFNCINPCGYAGMQMVRLADHSAQDVNLDEFTDMLINNIGLRHRNMTPLRNDENL